MKDFDRIEDFQELRKFNRSVFQKQETMNRIRKRTIKSSNPIKYVATSIATLLLAVLIFVPTFIFPLEQPNDSQDTLELLKSKIQLGMTNDEVKEILGEQYTESYYYDIPVWRYDLDKTGEYKFSGLYGIIDFEKMQQEKINMMIYIFWDKTNLVKHYSVLYLNDSDAKIYDFRVFANGEVFEEPIYPIEHPLESQNVDMKLFKSEMNLGITMDEVKEILGDYYSVKVPFENGIPIWIYEFGKEKEYHFFDEHGRANLEGMKQGKTKTQISIVWDENYLVEEYFALYFNESDNNVYEFRVFPNGEFKDNPIY